MTALQLKNISPVTRVNTPRRFKPKRQNPAVQEFPEGNNLPKAVQQLTNSTQRLRISVHEVQ